MKFFWLRSSLSQGTRWSGSYEASYRWGLPGAQCPTCRAELGGVALNYPNVSLSELQNEREYREARPVPWEEYLRLREGVLPLLPVGARLEPGSCFGPLRGRARGVFPPVVMQDPWTLLVARPVLQAMEQARLSGAVPVRVDLKGLKDPEGLYELQLLPQGKLASDCASRRGPSCATCGSVEDLWPDEWWLDTDALPTIDLCRLPSNPAIILASERAVAVLTTEGDTGVRAVDVTEPRTAA
ncbi:SitI6 family double-CXXCG motif immunity protein [Myxococcus qinghaiensis]|uniref:SitI6 family double-CXXCG motif immunity protein n=1 Tax=Myxococcus qinghaiensis TaxID=2906758 RepID=UPI0020A73AB2|nr:double-CXXCG motif protein [Myxococcus qinghaiensis]MCP3164996.1 double-CXXCG motif protein [Myxococcus qinghaiensis]